MAYASDPTVAEIHAECIQDQEPRLRIAKTQPDLLPVEFARVCPTGLVLARTLQGDEALPLRQEDGVLRCIGKQDGEEQADACRDGAEDQKEELPAVDGVIVDGANAPRHDAANDGGDAVAKEPGGLPGSALSVPRDR